MTQNHIISLEDMASRNIILFDTNVFAGYLGMNQQCRTIEQKLSRGKEKYEFICLLRRYFKDNKNIYITQRVYEELEQQIGFSYKRKVKKASDRQSRKLFVEITKGVK